MAKLELATAEVDNPYFSADHPEAPGNSRRIPVWVNRREAELAFRGPLEQHQVDAAKRFRDSWELMHGIRTTSSYERVNRSRSRSIEDQILDAGDDLRRCRALLGVRCYELVEAVCGHGQEISEMFPVKHRGILTSAIRQQRKIAAANLRASLDDMACMWGYYQPLGVDRVVPVAR